VDASSPYLENYVPFYDRLEQEVRRSVEKQRIYELNPFCCQPAARPYFVPTRISSKYQDVQSRYMKDLTSRDHLSQAEELACSSLNTSMVSILSLDRSIELVSSVEEYFF
jgi:hypothetical protein